MIGVAQPRQSKRVSWAPDVRLCQVRLFVSEDAPSESGFVQDHLQAKASWLLHALGPVSDDLPPGFETLRPISQFKADISQIPLTKWKCPPSIVLTPEWYVAAGEESTENAVQNQRVYGVLEAIYPRQSTIPPNPCVSSEVQDSYYDDSQTPLVPITAIEDEDTSELLLTDAEGQTHQPHAFELLESRTPNSAPAITYNLPETPILTHNEKPPVSTILGVEPDVVAAASAAFTAMMRSSEEGSLIDRDLLIKILSNPALIEKLLVEHGKHEQTQSALTTVPTPLPLETNVIASPPMPLPLPTVHGVRPNVPGTTAMVPQLIVNQQPSPVIPAVSKPAVSTPPAKDMSYYKSLIQRHGGEKPEAVDVKSPQFAGYPSESLGVKESDVVISSSKVKLEGKTTKFQKPCMYFNSPKGCRNGASCWYLHDLPVAVHRGNNQAKGSKRLKLDRGIADRI